MPADLNEVRYVLSPLQQGFLLNSLYDPDSGVDIVQVICTLREHIQVENFEKAWQTIYTRYAVMRTAFQWKGLHEFQQIVHTSVVMPLEFRDWRKVLPEALHSCLEDFIRADRQLSFDLSKAPLTRLTLCQASDTLYYFIFTFHHIILDGRSVFSLFNETFSLYHALCKGENLSLPVEVPYREFIGWLQRHHTATDKEFWEQWLKAFATPTFITNDGNFRKQADISKSYGDQETRLSATISKGLRMLVDENHLTLNTLLQGAWAILLSRYNRQDDVVFGVTRSCRRKTVEGSDDIIGLLINTLPMRIQLSPDRALLDWLKQIRTQNKELQEHIHSSLAQVQSWSEIQKGIPLFDHIVIFEDFTLNSALRSQGEKWENREFELRRRPNYPLTVYGFNESEFLIKIIYSQEHFDDDSIKLMLGHLQAILEGILANPNCKLGDLSLLTSEERNQLFSKVLAPELDRVRDLCIHELFEEQVIRTPNAKAVIFEKEWLTYHELNARANQLANYLRNSGVVPDALVGICMESSIEMIIGLLGILKAGAAYVPLNPTYPSDRVAFILQDTGVKILLTQSRLAAKFITYSAHIVSLDDEMEGSLQSWDRDNLTCTTTPANLAYIMYTSGSTGQPKGVQVAHHNVVSLFFSTEALFKFDEHDVWTLFHSFGFDFSVWEIFGALFHGGQLIIVPFWVSRSPEVFYDLLCEKQVSVLCQTPSAFYQLIRADDADQQHQQLGLRWVIFGGEKLEIANLRPWFLRHGDAVPRLVNMYGITETTVHVTFRVITLKDLEDPVTSVIGNPIPGWRIYIVDHYHQPVPIGIPGEIWVGGPGVSRGYHNRPDLTAQRFISDPFHKLPGERIYRSGDLARFLPSGEIEYLRRIDEQVKIRGFRIELGEIRACLNQHPVVLDCVVLMRERSFDDKQLIAYVVVQTETPSAGELREFLKTKLPEYMLPTAFVFLDSLPLTRNGKLDRQALPSPDWTVNNNAYVAPRNPTEKILEDIWVDVLHLKQVGVRDNFFELGGHSLLAAQAMARVREAFRMDLSLRQLFDSPTIEELAKIILEEQCMISKPSNSIQPTAGPANDLQPTPINRYSDQQVEDFLSEFFDESNG